MRGFVAKLIRKKVMQDLNKQGLKGRAKIVVFKKAVRETCKKYNALNSPVLPKVVLAKKQHAGESLRDFRERRKACNARRREREKAHG